MSRPRYVRCPVCEASLYKVLANPTIKHYACPKCNEKAKLAGLGVGSAEWLAAFQAKRCHPFLLHECLV